MLVLTGFGGPRPTAAGPRAPAGTPRTRGESRPTAAAPRIAAGKGEKKLQAADGEVEKACRRMSAANRLRSALTSFNQSAHPDSSHPAGTDRDRAMMRKNSLWETFQETTTLESPPPGDGPSMARRASQSLGNAIGSKRMVAWRAFHSADLDEQQGDPDDASRDEEGGRKQEDVHVEASPPRQFFVCRCLGVIFLLVLLVVLSLIIFRWLQTDVALESVAYKNKGGPR